MNSGLDGTITKAMTGKMHGMKHVKKNTDKFYDMTNFFAKIYSSCRAS